MYGITWESGKLFIFIFSRTPEHEALRKNDTKPNQNQNIQHVSFLLTPNTETKVILGEKERD